MKMTGVGSTDACNSPLTTFPTPTKPTPTVHSTLQSPRPPRAVAMGTKQVEGEDVSEAWAVGVDAVCDIGDSCVSLALPTDLEGGVSWAQVVMECEPRGADCETSVSKRIK